LKGTDEFWKAINNYKPQVLPKIIYKAYYDKDTKCITSAMSGPEDNPWPEGGIEISKELYKDTGRLYRMKVLAGKLVEMPAQDGSRLQLEKASDGTFTSLKDNIIFRASKGDNYKQKEYYVEISRNLRS
jgi:hypothetical protein